MFLTRIVVDDVSFGIDVNGIFELTVTHETYSRCRRGGELDVDCEISALKHIKMV